MRVSKVEQFILMYISAILMRHETMDRFISSYNIMVSFVYNETMDYSISQDIIIISPSIEYSYWNIRSLHFLTCNTFIFYPYMLADHLCNHIMAMQWDSV